MKILIIGNSFFPENSPRSFRTTELVKEFAARGNEVTVIIPKNNESHIEFEKKYKVKIINLGRKKWKDIDLSHGGKTTILLKRIIRRSLDMFFDYPSIEWMFKVKKALRDKSGYDLLISIAAPHPIHWGVSRVWKKDKRIARTWIADCGDPFMGTTTDTFRKPFYFKYVEKSWCKKADYISVPFNGAKEAYYKEFRNKIKIIPQGFNFKDVKLKEYIPNKIITFAYAGELIPGSRDPKELIKYLLNLEIDFKFILYTKSFDMVNQFVKLSKDKVELRSYIPRVDLLEVLSTMDFIVNFNNGVSTQLPSKLIDYYLTKRPVLSIDSFVLDKKIVDEFIAGNYKHQFKFDNPQQYRIENVCQEFLNLSKNA